MHCNAEGSDVGRFSEEPTPPILTRSTTEAAASGAGTKNISDVSLTARSKAHTVH